MKNLEKQTIASPSLSCDTKVTRKINLSSKETIMIKKSLAVIVVLAAALGATSASYADVEMPKIDKDTAVESPFPKGVDNQANG
jgi:hypothetical protein